MADGRPHYGAIDPSAPAEARPPRRTAAAAALLLVAAALTAGGAHQATPQLRQGADTAPGADTPATTKPHIVISLVDDQGYADAPWTAADGVSMPFAARLAEDGIVLTNYHASKVCSPSRAMLLTGQHQAALGLNFNIGASAVAGLPAARTLPEYVEAAAPGAYRKAFVGKWGLGFAAPEHWPLRRGFDSTFFMAGDELGDWFAHTTAASASSAPTFDWHRDDAPTSDHSGAYSTFAFRDEALAVIAALGDKRLLLYQAWNAVHATVAVPDDFAGELGIAGLMHQARERGETATRATFLGALKLVDDANAAVFGALGERARDTVWLQTSDNGGIVKDGGNNYPLRGEKNLLFQGGFHVPCFLWLGAGLRPAAAPPKAYGGLVFVADVLPTLVGGFLGADPGDGLYGVDLSRAILGEPGAPEREEVLLWAAYDALDPGATAYAYRDNRYKVVAGTSLCSVANAAAGDAEVLCVCEAESSANKTMVFDLAADPQEGFNLLETGDPALLAGLRGAAQRAWDATVGRQLPAAATPAAAAAAANASRLGGDAFVAPWLDGAADAGPAWPFGALPAWVGRPHPAAPNFTCSAGGGAATVRSGEGH